MSRRFWLIASLFYVGALLAHLAFVINDECGFAFIAGAQSLYWGMILVLLTFEWWAYRRYRARMTRRTGIGLLIAHIVLFEATAAVDCAATTVFLYLLIPFMAYLFINHWSAIGLAILYFTWFAVYFRIFRVDPLEDYLLRSIIFGLSMLFSVAMAGVIKEILVSQAQERRLFAELQQAHHQLEAYAAQLKAVGAYEERNRLARDIHDSVGHYLAAVTVQLEKALAFHTSDPVQSERAILDAKQAARDALADVRRSVGALRQSTETFFLTAALRELVRRSSSAQLKVDLIIEGEEIGYAPSALMALYRVAQEGLTNVQRHAAAGHATITLHMGNETASMIVADDGKGFDVPSFGAPWQQLSSQQHQGLHGMRERLALAGGYLQVESSHKTGTTLMAVIPKQSQILSGRRS